MRIAFGLAQAGRGVFVDVSVGVSVGIVVLVGVAVGVSEGASVGVDVSVGITVNVGVGGISVSVGRGVVDGFDVAVDGIGVVVAQAVSKLALNNMMISQNRLREDMNLISLLITRKIITKFLKK